MHGKLINLRFEYPLYNIWRTRSLLLNSSDEAKSLSLANDLVSHQGCLQFKDCLKAELYAGSLGQPKHSSDDHRALIVHVIDYDDRIRNFIAPKIDCLVPAA